MTASDLHHGVKPLRPPHEYEQHERAMRDLPGAIQAYNEAIGIDPAIEVYVVSARGLALLESGNCKAAIQDFNKVLILNAKSPATLQNRARCLHRTGMYDEAVADFTRALYITPSDATLFAERGNSFLYGKDAATAERDINHALKLDPKNALALRNRGRLHIVQKISPKHLPTSMRRLHSQPPPKHAPSGSGY